jgi:hypothetical protein
MKALEKIKANSTIIMLVISIFLFFKQCGISRDIDRIEKNIKVLTYNVDSLQKSQMSKQEVKQTMNEVMFDFLIYEDDFDKGKSSLSDIKSKIKSPADAKDQE